MKFKSLVIIPILISSVQAKEFAPLLEEFLSENQNVLKNKYEAANAYLDVDATLAAKTWELSSTLSRTDNKQDSSSSSSNSQQTITDALSLDLSKSWRTGTEFTFSNTYNKIDRSRYNSATLGSASQDLYSFTQGVSLSQDLGSNFFGKEFGLTVDIAKQSAKATQQGLEVKDRDAALSFYDSFINLKMNQTKVDLQQEALARALKRRNITKRRVRDGLNEKVDLYQSEINYLRQEEGLTNSIQDYKSSIEIISKSLHRKVKKDEVKKVKISAGQMKDKIKGKLEENLDVQSLKENLKLAQLQLTKNKRSFMPEITLSAGYETNDFDPTSSEVFSEGNISSAARELSVAVSISMPLGFEEEKIEKAQLVHDKLSYEMRLRKTQNNLKFSEENLNNQLRTLIKNAKSSVQRIKLAELALKENIRLYNLGRIELDRLIQSEEDLISNQRNFVDNWGNYKKTLARKSLLYGSLKDYLLTE